MKIKYVYRRLVVGAMVAALVLSSGRGICAQDEDTLASKLGSIEQKTLALTAQVDAEQDKDTVSEELLSAMTEQLKNPALDLLASFAPSKAVFIERFNALRAALDTFSNNYLKAELSPQSGVGDTHVSSQEPSLKSELVDESSESQPAIDVTIHDSGESAAPESMSGPVVEGVHEAAVDKSVVESSETVKSQEKQDLAGESQVLVSVEDQSEVQTSTENVSSSEAVSQTPEAAPAAESTVEQSPSTELVSQPSAEPKSAAPAPVEAQSEAQTVPQESPAQPQILPVQTASSEQASISLIPSNSEPSVSVEQSPVVVTPAPAQGEPAVSAVQTASTPASIPTPEVTQPAGEVTAPSA